MQRIAKATGHLYVIMHNIEGSGVLNHRLGV